ncbi:MAG: iron-containing alcohol dehydrogenase [Kiritimatiellae bacterium]|nr:iron-containing alcohol dehydrogenase [Kiritimatiellia bacterium]
MDILPSNLLLPQRVISRPGAVADLSLLAAPFGADGLIVHGRSFEASGALARLCDTFSTPPSSWRHEGGEPTVQAVDALRAAIRKNRPDWVAAIGGGSVMDLAKAAAGLADARLPTGHYQRHPEEIPPATLPLIAVPTTAGTGSEATVVSVLTDAERGLKQSIRHPTHLPRCVILDPELLHPCPSRTRAASGLDAFVQAYESLTSIHATPFTRALSETALVQLTENLLPFYQGDNLRAPAMLQASFLAGVALSHARLGIIHGLAHPLGIRFHAPHGLACACCLPACLALNRPAIQPDLDRLKARYGIDIPAQVDAWMRAMTLPNPFRGAPIPDREAVIRETLASGSTKANPVPITEANLSPLLDEIGRAP